MLVTNPSVHLINREWLPNIASSMRTILRSDMWISNILHRVTRSIARVFSIITIPLEHKQTKPSTMFFMIDFIRLHVEERIHKRVRHEKGIKVLIHANEIVFSTPAWPVLPLYFLQGLASLCVVFGEIFANLACFEAPFSNLIRCLSLGNAVRMSI